MGRAARKKRRTFLCFINLHNFVYIRYAYNEKGGEIGEMTLRNLEDRCIVLIAAMRKKSQVVASHRNTKW